MSKSKSYNRIVFLTTLSVYLGLVLVSGTAPVLAHSALTRSFDIKNEIEVKDDLDKKPDNEKIESFSKDDFPILFAELLNIIKDEVEDGKISVPLPNFYDARFFIQSADGGGGSRTSIISNPHLDDIIENAVGQKFRAKAFELADFDGQTKSVNINLIANISDLSLKISFSKLKAVQFAEFLNREFSSSANSAEDKLLKQIYENTNATAENNQVFIVTRLPRAAIDSLLK